MIVVEQLSIHQGAFRIEGVSFTLDSGEHGVLMGKTGSGKTTVIDAICGLRPVRSGRIMLDGRDVTHAKPAERGVGYVPQDGALFPSMTVREHLGFALNIRRWSKPAIDERVEELARLLGIEYLTERYPLKLSGGERQRVALGRALAFKPTVLLFDEPMSALDEDTKEEMYTLLKQVGEATGVTTLHVTHSSEEARRLADKLFVIREGCVIETPLAELPVRSDRNATPQAVHRENAP